MVGTAWEDKSVFGILRKINRELATKVPDARAFAVNAPPVDGLSSTGGFEIYIQNRASFHGRFDCQR
jgi:multidrug efflux pump subunit AcrB